MEFMYKNTNFFNKRNIIKIKDLLRLKGFWFGLNIKKK
jgi:hypothetical protein